MGLFSNKKELDVSNEEDYRRWVQASVKSSLSKTGDPEYLKTVADAAVKAGNREFLDEALDAFNEGKGR